MLPFLKNHPFAVEAFFENSVVLTYAIPKEQLQKLIPECLTLDTFKNEFAFVAIALVKTKNLRPKGFPKMLGNDFYLIGYRIFVRYTNETGKNLRGLYILKSETDKNKMQFFGNIFTHYKYSTTDITEVKHEHKTEIKSIQSKFNIAFEDTEDEIPLPKNSPFADWKEARKFAGPLPFTFTYNAKTKKVLIIEGIRQHWIPKPINILNCKVSFLEGMNLNEAILANAFIIKNIPYYWKKGKIEQWHQ